MEIKKMQPPKMTEWPSVGKLRMFLDIAKPGTAYVYHYGNLAWDRGPEEAPIAVVDDVANLAWHAYERRLVVLCQVKIRKNYYAYVAIKRTPRKRGGIVI